jgi:hypothetical protein
MITNLFHPPKYGLLQCTYVDSQPYLEDHPFEDLELLFDEDSQPSLCLNFDGHEALVSSKQLETQFIEDKCFHLGDFYKDLQMKMNNFLVVGGFLSPDMGLSLTFYLLLWEAMQFSSDLSSPLSLW